MKYCKNYILIVSLLIGITGCKKEDENPLVEDNFALRQEILRDLGTNVIFASYNDMAVKSATLVSLIDSFAVNVTDVNLISCRNQWKSLRASWEQTEGFLFGPVATNNIDPRIDSWPINHQDLDSLLLTNEELNEQYVNGLQESLKGFHLLEYLLFGNNGTKQATDFTEREILFVKALSRNLEVLCSEIANSWSTTQNSSYYFSFVNAGAGSSIYATQEIAYLELVNALIGICDEAANGKINEPFTLANPALEESPYSANSITDFKNNINSVKNIYNGKYLLDGKGLTDFIRIYNLSLDNTIQLQINEALQALENITDPFGQAIFSQPLQIQNAVEKINILKTTLETDLRSLVQLKFKV